MASALPPDLAAETARTLRALRHALADPLSSASLNLDLVERRALSPAGAEPTWVVERVRATQADLGEAARLLDLLLRLAEIDEEVPEETSLREACGAAGVALALPESPAASARLRLRPRSTSEALRDIVRFSSRAADSSSTEGRAVLEAESVTLSFEGPEATADGRPGMLLDLPHGLEEAEPLYVARAAAEADGGTLRLQERGGRLVAIFSWPLAPAPRSREDV